MLRSPTLRAFFAAALIIAPLTLRGHDDVATAVAALTLQIEQAPTADLYYKRALEYRALRKRTQAKADLQSALLLDPRNRFATIALIQLCEPGPQAHRLIQHYASFAQTPEEEFEATFLLARYYSQIHLAPISLFLCQGLQTLRLDHNPALDLLHAQVHLDLGQPAKAAGILKKAWHRTHSIVLRNNWIDTALTAGLTKEILPIIQSELTTSRFRSSWLIRRARAARIHQDEAQVNKDLLLALTELTPRIRPAQPDLTLIADRGLIYALLGEHDLAHAALRTLRSSVLPPSSYRILSHHLSEQK